LRLGFSTAQSVLFPINFTYLVDAPSWQCSRPGWMGSEQPGLVESVPAHGRGVGTRWSFRSLPTQTILWFYDIVTWPYN